MMEVVIYQLFKIKPSYYNIMLARIKCEQIKNCAAYYAYLSLPIIMNVLVTCLFHKIFCVVLSLSY